MEAPLLADECVRRFAAQALEALAVVVSQQKGVQGLVELGGRLRVVALPGGLFARVMEALDRAIGPGGRLG